MCKVGVLAIAFLALFGLIAAQAAGGMQASGNYQVEMKARLYEGTGTIVVSIHNTNVKNASKEVDVTYPDKSVGRINLEFNGYYANFKLNASERGIYSFRYENITQNIAVGVRKMGAVHEALWEEKQKEPTHEQMNDATQGALIGIFIAIVGALFYYSGISQYRTKKIMDYLPTCKAIALAPGMAELEGIAHSSEQGMVSPFSKKPCAYYRTTVSKTVGKEHTDLKALESKAPVILEDDTGSVEISLSPGAVMQAYNFYGMTESAEVSGKEIAYEKHGKLLLFLEEMGIPKPKEHEIIEVTELILPEGANAYVLGKAVMKHSHENGEKIAIANDGSGKFLLSVVGEKETGKKIWAGSYMAMISGIMLVMASGVAARELFEYFGFGFAPQVCAAAALVMLANIGYINMIEAYNGIVALRGYAQKAGANVDALLDMRNALVPSLARVVSGALRHENEVLRIAAMERSDAYEKDKGSLYAMIEASPKLRAAQNVILLQNQVEGVEARIAASRQFMNDSAMQYNEKISKFPFSILAKLAGLGRMEYYSQR